MGCHEKKGPTKQWNSCKSFLLFNLKAVKKTELMIQKEGAGEGARNGEETENREIGRQYLKKQNKRKILNEKKVKKSGRQI